MPKPNREDPEGWDPVATWYDGWVGQKGSEHHRNLAIPVLLDLLDVQARERVLDVGSGQGVLAPHIAREKASYTGVEISRRLVGLARRRHGRQGRFLCGDARRLPTVPGVSAESVDAVAFLLSIQDMNPLADVLCSAAWALRGGGRLVILMTHPCFRVPRQSGWGHDARRHLKYRRIDRYLTPLSVPMKCYGKRRRGATVTFHRPLSHYVNGLADCGLLVDCLREICTHNPGRDRAEQCAFAEIPLFLGIRARKQSPPRSAVLSDVGKG